MSTASPRLVFAALHTVKASEITQRSRRESKAAFKRYLWIQLSSRSEKRLIVSMWSWTIRTCLRRSRMCVWLRYSIYTSSVRCVTYLMLYTCKFSAPLGLSTCRIVILGNQHHHRVSHQWSDTMCIIGCSCSVYRRVNRILIPLANHSCFWTLTSAACRSDSYKIDSLQKCNVVENTY